MTESVSSASLVDDLDRERGRVRLHSRFLSLVSHEFRTPLTVILSSCELLENYGHGWDEIRRKSHFRRIHASVADMTALLDNVALLARFDSGKHAISTDSVRLDQMLRALDEETAAFRKEGQKLTPSAHPGDGEFRGDSRLLRAVALNLLANAFRFSPEGSPVDATFSLIGGGLELLVADRGSGLPEGEEDLVWTAFERGSNAKGVPGSGLGLAIVRRCMELAGGRAQLRSREGGGLEALAVFPMGEAS